MSEEEDATYAWRNQFIFKLINRFKEPGNETEDFSKPLLRPVFYNIYPLLIFVYSLLIICGIIINFSMFYHILKFKLYRDPTNAFLINMIISDVIKCIFVLPISLAVMLIDNWIFGKFLCFFLPILQDIPFHVSMMTYMLIAVDRFRMIDDPGKPRIPAFVCALGTWFFAVCIVLPYPIYTTYLDLESYHQTSFKGVGMCFANLAEDMQDYMRGLFIGTYVAPLSIMAYLYVKASRELQNVEGPLAIGILEASRYENNAENDIIIAKLALHETYENSGYFDVSYTVFVWIAFLPTVTTPGIYASWQMSRMAKERLRGYFRFSNRLRNAREDSTASRSEPQTIVTSNVDQLHHFPIGSISGSNCGSTGGRAGSMRGSTRGSVSTRGSSNAPSPDSLSINNMRRMTLIK
ncbi:neuropeptide Y receptor type 6 [Belonocnema kinseyi]|uniref:neuropeptide Y receptor type 6 n=1 Tax=Belonocnema kinseyi TaxID=2817044 RepID=UPI00143CE031|nr:neuropeptide Y receptor type 6 [Belonocnema kinseyi]